MTAALKMAAPGELCSQLKKLMVFCKDPARSIKAMRQHLAVTQAVMDALLKQALEQNLLWKQSNGMYKTTNTKLALLDVNQAAANTEAEQTPANSSLLALDTPPEAAEGSAFSVNQQADDADAEVIDVDAELAELVELQLIKTDGHTLQLNEPASTNAMLQAELNTLAEALNPDQYPVIDDISNKQLALSGIALLLRTRTPALAGIVDQLATELSVIRLHQERRV
jgi:hypothetical protein